MQQYLDLLKNVLENGVKKQDRTGVGTLSIFGAQMRFDLSKGFPLLTTKKLNTKAIIYELLWFIQGQTNIKWLNDHGIHIWDPWADQNGELGRIYGYQWRGWTAENGRRIDQLKNAIETIKNNPTSRRIIVSAWNVGDLDKMALPPCHILFQFYVDTENRRLSLQLYQRSADLFIGVPFNIASYSLLLLMVAQVTGYQPGEFIHTLGDTHIYLNHIQQVKQQLQRTPKPLPTVKLNPDVKCLFDFTYDDIKIENYQAWPHIKAPVAV